jgi:hypothetical protein
LNKLNRGYEEHITKTKVTHLKYMDDLKLIGKTEEEIERQMQAAGTFTDDIQMEFALFEKCAKLVLNRGQLVHSLILISDFKREIKELEKGKTYKYVGIEESEGIQHQKMTERFKRNRAGF